LTDRLHLTEPRLYDFEATVLAAEDGHVVLDRTGFYAEGGGQLGDRGSLKTDWGVWEVTDTQIVDGVVRHAVPGPLPRAGTAVEGRLDRPFRRAQSAMHTAQHMLSEALARYAEANTVSARLGEDSFTIDLDVPSIDPDAIEEVEEILQGVIDEDRPVLVRFPSPTELAAMTLRSRPKVDRGIRVVEIAGFDLTPCGGTHCTSTAEVGLLRRGTPDSVRGLLRVRYQAGRPALDALVRRDGVVRGLSAEFTCGWQDVPAAVARVQQSAKDAQMALGAARKDLHTLLVAAALAEHPPQAVTPILLVRDDDPTAGKQLAARLALRGDVAALVLCRAGDTWRFALKLGDGVDRPMSAWVKDVLSRKHGGRGGGRPPAAQGQLPGDVDLSTLRADLEQFARG
jgi:alanyl-tRNA synthetase